MTWDKEKCAEGILAPDLNDEIRANWAALEAALDYYHYFATGGVQTGRPRPGSARPYFQDAAPTARLDTGYFTSDDYGTIWIDSNATIDNQFNILTAADGAGTETWTPISTEVIAVLLAAARVFAGTLGVTGNFAVNTDKFTVAAATGATVVAGTLGVTGIATLAKASLLASSDAPTTDAMVANKKYVDDSQKNQCRMYLGSTQSNLSHGVATIVALDTDDYDPDNVSDTANYKITPSAAGYYQVIGQVTFAGDNLIANKSFRVGIYKNTTLIALGNSGCVDIGQAVTAQTSTVISLNGSTDYIQIKATSYSDTNLVDINSGSNSTFLVVARVG